MSCVRDPRGPSSTKGSIKVKSERSRQARGVPGVARMPDRESAVRSRIVTIRHATSYFGDFAGPTPPNPKTSTLCSPHKLGRDPWLLICTWGSAQTRDLAIPVELSSTARALGPRVSWRLSTRHKAVQGKVGALRGRRLGRGGAGGCLGSGGWGQRENTEAQRAETQRSARRCGVTIASLLQNQGTASSMDQGEETACGA